MIYGALSRDPGAFINDDRAAGTAAAAADTRAARATGGLDLRVFRNDNRSAGCAAVTTDARTAADARAARFIALFLLSNIAGGCDFATFDANRAAVACGIATCAADTGSAFAADGDDRATFDGDFATAATTAVVIVGSGITTATDTRGQAALIAAAQGGLLAAHRDDCAAWIKVDNDRAAVYIRNASVARAVIPAPADAGAIPFAYLSVFRMPPYLVHGAGIQGSRAGDGQ